MAYSKCAHCDNSSFEIREVSPRGAGYKYNFIQCSSCGAPVGVVSYYNLDQTILQIEKLVKAIAYRVGA